MKLTFYLFCLFTTIALAVPDRLQYQTIPDDKDFAIEEFSEESKCINLPKAVQDFKTAYYFCAYVPHVNKNNFIKKNVETLLRDNLSKCPDGSVRILNMNKLFGDPCPHIKKTLVLIYTPEHNLVLSVEQPNVEQGTENSIQQEKNEEQKIDSSEPTPEVQENEIEEVDDLDDIQ